MSRYRDPQLQVVEKYSYLFNLRPHIYNTIFVPNNSDLIYLKNFKNDWGMLQS